MALRSNRRKSYQQVLTNESARVVAPVTVSTSTCTCDEFIPTGDAAAHHTELSGGPHQMEADVQRALLDCGDARFSHLVVRRMPNGVCLQGVMEVTGETTPDVAGLVRRAAKVDQIINHLLICNSRDRH